MRCEICIAEKKGRFPKRYSDVDAAFVVLTFEPNSAAQGLYMLNDHISFFGQLGSRESAFGASDRCAVDKGKTRRRLLLLVWRMPQIRGLQTTREGGHSCQTVQVHSPRFANISRWVDTRPAVIAVQGSSRISGGGGGQSGGGTLTLSWGCQG